MTMKNAANLLLGFAIVATVAFVVLIAAGALVTWYVETRFGVDAVAEAVQWIGFAGAFLAAAGVIFVGWYFANQSHVEGARTANQAQENSAAVMAEMFKAMTTAQKADAYTAKAISAHADADAKIRVLDYKYQLDTDRKALPAPEPEPVRRAPWERALPAPRDEDNQDNAAGARFSRMY
jgi:hypothetical protein